MAYDKRKVDFSDKEHSQASRLDAAVEVWVEKLGDGFQIGDLASLGPTALNIYSVANEVIADFKAANARRPTVPELAEILATRLMMLARDNDWLGVGA